MKHIRGFIFDLDGTLVTSSLDFTAIRQEIGCPATEDILTFLDTVPGDRKASIIDIVHRHEMNDAQESDWLPHVRPFLAQCAANDIPMAIVTRNSAIPTQVKVGRNEIPIQHIVTRETSKPKPDPTALINIANDFNLPTEAIMMVGDYKYDLQAGRNAKMATCLVNFTQLPDYAHLADYTFAHFGLLHRAFFHR